MQTFLDQKNYQKAIKDLKKLNNFQNITKAELGYLEEQQYYFVSPGHIQKKRKTGLSILKAIKLQRPNHEQLQRLIQSNRLHLHF